MSNNNSLLQKRKYRRTTYLLGKQIDYYKLDDDGYVVVEFVDQKGCVLNLKNAIFRLSISDSFKESTLSKSQSEDWATLAGVNSAFAKLVDTKNLTREAILDTKLTDLVRGAYYNDYLAKKIRMYLGFRPLPLKTTILNNQGQKIACRLFLHQIKGLTFMREREALGPHSVYGLRGGVIKMEMGLGKTLLAIAHSLISPRPSCSEKYGEKGFPTLIIASKTVMIEWKVQGFEKFFGDRVKVLYLHKDYLGRDIDHITRRQVVKYDFVVTTYDVCSSICRKRAFYEDILEIGNNHTLMKGKVVSVCTRTRLQADKPAAVGPAVIYTTPWERVFCDECFTADTRIVTDQGNIRIKAIHKMKEKPQALSFDKERQAFEYKKITHTWKKKRVQNLYEISFGRKKYKCTPGHKWLTKDGYREAKNIRVGDVIIASEDNKLSPVCFRLNEDQEHVVLGSFLGDGHIQCFGSGKYRLKVIHGEKQRAYCEWKASLFGCEVREIDKNGYAGGKAYTFQTKIFYSDIDFVSNKTAVPQGVIDKLDVRSLVIWYLDDGSIDKGYTISLHTESFDTKSQEALRDKLKELGFEANIRQTKKKYMFLIILNVSTKKLIAFIESYVPDIDCIRYKVFPIERVLQIEDETREPDETYHKLRYVPVDKFTCGDIVTTKKNRHKRDYCIHCAEETWFSPARDRKNERWKCIDCRRKRDIKRYRYSPRIPILFEPPPLERYEWDKTRCEHGYIIVTNIKEIDSIKYEYTYDIEVEDNHNFVLGSMSQNNVTHGPVVSNSQRFANSDTQIYRYIMAIYGKYKWCLTGTPIRNYLSDIWSQLRFCGYDGVTRKIIWNRVGTTKMKSHCLTSAIFSMNYKDAGIILPKKHEYEIYISLDDREKECYNYVLGIARNVYDEMMRGLCDFSCVLALFTRLRQCSIASYLITAKSKRKKKKQEKDYEAINMMKEIYTGTLGAWVHNKTSTAGIYSKKMTEIVRIIKNMSKGEKILIFSMFTSALDLTADTLRKCICEFGFVQIDGDTKGVKRKKLLTQFRTNRKIQGLLMTYKVGSEGLNLTEATHVICIEPWYTYMVRNQGVARCWRLGQVSEVKVYNIYVKNSIEERIVAICKKKYKMAEEMLKGTCQHIKVGLDIYTLGRILGIRS